MNGLLTNVTLAPAGVEVALLDSDGVIAEVNEAWTAFTLGNGGDPSRTGVGVSYLDMCDSAGEDEASVAVAAAVRAAIGGDLPAPMTIRISCDGPGAPRQFDVLVSSRVSATGEQLGATVTLSPTTPAPATVPDDDGRVLPGNGAMDLHEASALRAQDGLRALTRAHAAAAGGLSLPVVLRHIVGAAQELVDARCAALRLVGADRTLVELVHSGDEPATVQGRGGPPHGEGPPALLVNDPVPLKEPERHPEPSAAPGHHRARTGGSLEVAIRIRDQVLGHLCLTECTRGEFTDEDEQLVTAMMGSAGVVIENARLAAQVAQQRQWLEASTEMTQRLFAGGADDPLDLVMRYAARGASADFARVVVPHDDRHGRVHAQMGSIDDRQTGDLFPLDSTVGGRLLATAEPVLVSDHDGEFAEPPHRTDPSEAPGAFPALAGVPVLDAHGKVLGALLVRRSPGSTPLTADDLSLLGSFANHAGIAIALDRAQADREALAMMADHDRIAADLHDHVIQQLFATGMGLNALVPHQDRPEHQQRLLGYVGALDDTIRRIRTTIFDLQYRHPTALGLRERLMAVLDDQRHALGVRVRIDFSGDLDSKVSTALGDDVVAVLREALSNIARHAGAQSATIRVAMTESVLEVHVIDDGTGIGNPTRSSGLANLRRRAGAHQGTFDVVSPKTGGTHLRWTAKVSRERG